ncbi:hypothetical protein M0R45_006958 [Rubus argutus]|uniref:Uncharacterized protein n=1 Tax=Rubus argutus TaxID=59490 RepID=A0AAW1YSX8_RUBAR
MILRSWVAGVGQIEDRKITLSAFREPNFRRVSGRNKLGYAHLPTPLLLVRAVSKTTTGAWLIAAALAAPTQILGSLVTKLGMADESQEFELLPKESPEG